MRCLLLATPTWASICLRIEATGFALSHESPNLNTVACLAELSSLLDVLLGRLLCCCRQGDIEAVEDFIAIGRDVNEKDKDGRTPLHYAGKLLKTSSQERDAW